VSVISKFIENKLGLILWALLLSIQGIYVIDFAVENFGKPLVAQSLETFLQAHNYKRVDRFEFHQGDIIVTRGPKGEISAIVDIDSATKRVSFITKRPDKQPEHISMPDFNELVQMNECEVYLYHKD